MHLGYFQHRHVKNAYIVGIARRRRLTYHWKLPTIRISKNKRYCIELNAIRVGILLDAVLCGAAMRSHICWPHSSHSPDDEFLCHDFPFCSHTDGKPEQIRVASVQQLQLEFGERFAKAPEWEGGAYACYEFSNCVRLSTFYFTRWRCGKMYPHAACGEIRKEKALFHFSRVFSSTINHVSCNASVEKAGVHLYINNWLRFYFDAHLNKSTLTSFNCRHNSQFSLEEFFNWREADEIEVSLWEDRHQQCIYDSSYVLKFKAMVLLTISSSTHDSSYLLCKSSSHLSYSFRNKNFTSTLSLLSQSIVLHHIIIHDH